MGTLLTGTLGSIASFQSALYILYIQNGLLLLKLSYHSRTESRVDIRLEVKGSPFSNLFQSVTCSLSLCLPSMYC